MKSNLAICAFSAINFLLQAFEHIQDFCHIFVMRVDVPCRFDTVIPKLFELDGCVREFFGDSVDFLADPWMFGFYLADDLLGWLGPFRDLAPGCKIKGVKNGFRVFDANAGEDFFDDLDER